MTWVKRGGGMGTGIYGRGVVPAGSTTEPQPRVRSTPKASGGPGPGHNAPDSLDESVPAPAYQVSQWSQVRDNKIMLDLLAHGVATQGWAPEMSIYYEDTLATFWATSAHFLAACRGEQGAGVHYQRTVAGGRFRNGEVR